MDAVLYARLSVSRDESVSIERQLESCRKYAEARGWRVVGEYTDDGVSATKMKPEARDGWRQVLSHPSPFRAVVVWKTDRLARSVLDFLNTDKALQERGAALVSATESVDMTTASGRAFATVLAVFAQMEADNISERVTAARRQLAHAGRWSGGPAPYGFQTIPNPDGPGKILAHDPERVESVRELIRRFLAGDSLHSLTAYMRTQPPRPGKDEARWFDTTIKDLLRNPALAGMLPHHPGRKKDTKRDPWAVVRDEDGVPVVSEDLALISTEERRWLLESLEARTNPMAGRNFKTSEGGLVAGIVRCGSCGQKMYRKTRQVRGKVHPCYACNGTNCEAPQFIGRSALDAEISRRLLEERPGHQHIVRTRREVDPSRVVSRLNDIEGSLMDAAAALTEDGADHAAILARIDRLKARRTEAKSLLESPMPEHWDYLGISVHTAWESAETDEERAKILSDQILSLTIHPAPRMGAKLNPARIHLDWREI